MNPQKSVLILYRPGDSRTHEREALVDALEKLGARVVTCPFGGRYDEITEAIERADTVVLWR